MQKISENTFRSAFKLVDNECLRWFPGHMNKGLKQMQEKLRFVDCIIEVHDARIPFSGRNPDFKHTVSGIKPIILVLNKMDLIDNRLMPKIKRELKSQYPHVIFTNCKNSWCKGVQNLFPLAQKLIANADRYNRTKEPDFNMMVIGVPNVGKSSLINSLRNRLLHRRSAAPTGALAGVTRSVMNKIKISDNPRFYLFDTPGILTPGVPDVETGLKLAVSGCLQDHLVGETVLADYLLYILNKYQYFYYVQRFQLEKPTDNILELLTHISKIENKVLKIRSATNEYVVRPNFDEAAKLLIRAFRVGELGKIMLDMEHVL